MAETILFPDAEQLLVDYLEPLLTIAVGTRVPNPRPDQFVRVLRTGGVRATLVTDGAQLTFESWDVLESRAADTAQLLRAYVLALPGSVLAGHIVTKVEEAAGPANLPDPDTGIPRYSQTHVVHLRGAAI